MVIQSPATRLPLSRDRVLRAAIAVADDGGIENLSMRNLAESLGVKAMSLYNHVANKEDILNGVVDVLVDEIETLVAGDDMATLGWKAAMRRRAISARTVLLAHPWAPGIVVSRTVMTPTMLRYMDSVVGIFRGGGFSVGMAHHAMHALGSRVLGFTQELFETDDLGPEVAEVFSEGLAAGQYTHIAEIAREVSHDSDTTLGGGCDDQVEFEFALDLMLDGLDGLRDSE